MLHTGPHCLLAPAWAVEEARKDGVKGAEPGWLGSLVLGVEFPSSHALGGHAVSGSEKTFFRWHLAPGGENVVFPAQPLCGLLRPLLP